MLTASTLPFYLFSTGLAKCSEVVDGPFRIAEFSRRNRNFKISRACKPGLFVKQPLKSDQAFSVQREAQFYVLVRDRAEFAPLREVVPKFLWFDPTECVLVTELIENSESISDRHRRQGFFPAGAGNLLGQILGSLHRGGEHRFTSPTDRIDFPGQLPWPMLVSDNLDGIVAATGWPGMEVRSWIYTFPGLVEALARLRTVWRIDSVIHGDIRWDNGVFAGESQLDLKLTDWELVDRGDSAWDVAAILKETYVAQAFAVCGSANGELLVVEMARAVREFWCSYREARGFDAADAHEFLKRAFPLAAARLVMSALEHMLHVPSPWQAAAMLHASYRILQNPVAWPAELET